MRVRMMLSPRQIRRSIETKSPGFTHTISNGRIYVDCDSAKPRIWKQDHHFVGSKSQNCRAAPKVEISPNVADSEHESSDHADPCAIEDRVRCCLRNHVREDAIFGRDSSQQNYSLDGPLYTIIGNGAVFYPGWRISLPVYRQRVLAQPSSPSEAL